MDDIIFYFWIAGFPAVLLAILVLSYFVKRRRAKRLTEFARLLGWTCTHSWGLTGPGKRFTIRPESGDDWELRVRRRSTAGQAGSIPGRAEFRTGAPSFPGEFAMFSTAGGFKRGFRTVAAVMRVVGLVFGRTIASWIYGRELGENLLGLRDFEAPEGLDLAIFATSDPRDKFDLKAISRAANQMGHGSQRLQPSVRISDGLQVVVEHEVKFPGTGEDFIAGCLELQANLLGGSPVVAPTSPGGNGVRS